MKTSPLVLQLTEARPRKPKVPKVKAAPEPAPEPVEAPSELDAAKGEAFDTYEADWRYKALDEFNIEQGTEFHLDDNQSNDEDYMQFDDGGVQWMIYKDNDTAEAAAIAQVAEDLDNEPELFSAEFIQRHVNQEKLKNTLWQDVREHRSEDLSEMDQDDAVQELIRNGALDEDTAYTEKKEFYRMSPSDRAELTNQYLAHLQSITTDEEAQQAGHQTLSAYLAAEKARVDELDDEAFATMLLDHPSFPAIDEDEFFTSEKVLVDNIDDLIDSAKDAYLDKLGEEFDPMDWLNDVYGEEDAQKQAVEIGGIDKDAAAKDAVSTDGWPHFLNRYDSNSSDLHSGAVYFRSS